MTVSAEHARPRRTRQGRATAPAKTRHHPRPGDGLNRTLSQTQDLSWLVTDFTERVTDVEHAAVVSSDGVPADRLENLSAITSGLISLARGTAVMFEGGAVIQTLVAMQQGVLVIVAISDGSSLAVLTRLDADLDQVAYEMTVLAEQAGGVLTPDARPPPEAARERA